MLFFCVSFITKVRTHEAQRFSLRTGHYLRHTCSGQAAKSTDASQNKDAQQNLQVPRTRPAKNIMISAANGITPRGNHIEAGYKKLVAGADTLEAAIITVSGPENDPEDDSVGLGGLPMKIAWWNWMPAACMAPHVALDRLAQCATSRMWHALARTVMEHTGHVMLVGQGATHFAELMGFPKENLLTEHSRKIWQLWKEYHSDLDWWGPGFADPNFKIPPNLETGWLEEQPQPIKRLYALAAEIGISEDRRLDAMRKCSIHPPARLIARH